MDSVELEGGFAAWCISLKECDFGSGLHAILVVDSFSWYGLLVCKSR